MVGAPPLWGPKIGGKLFFNPLNENVNQLPGFVSSKQGSRKSFAISSSVSESKSAKKMSKAALVASVSP